MGRRKALSPCAEPGCPELTPETLCSVHEQARRAKADSRRPNSAGRGYGGRWPKIRAAFLREYPFCIDCEAEGRITKATVADHDPVPRRELVRRGDPNPDAWHHLKPRCAKHHGQREGWKA